MRKRHLSVWAVIGYTRAYGGEIDKVIEDLEITREELEVAVLYYFRTKKAIDKRFARDAA